MDSHFMSPITEGEKERFRGVMAQDVETIRPEAVVENGWLQWPFADMINVPFEKLRILLIAISSNNFKLVDLV